MIDKNIKTFEKRLSAALTKAGRNKEHFKVMLATKTISPDILKTVISKNYKYFGENRVQELSAKQDELPKLGITWDFIGHLQSNKVKDVVGKVNLIHSVDRISLATEIQKQAEKQGVRQKILIEINTSNEESKSGVSVMDWQNLAVELLTMPNIEICGLMTIAVNSEDESQVRQCFRDLYNIRIGLAKLMKREMQTLELSMGMSGDFALAIEEGATIIRVGSLIFGQRI